LPHCIEFWGGGTCPPGPIARSTPAADLFSEQVLPRT